jgi:hypothetical protein
MDYKIILCVIVVIVIIGLIVLFTVKSTFTVYNDTYESNGCTQDNRTYPSGNVPGSWLGMTTAEKNNLVNFINNSSVI